MIIAVNIQMFDSPQDQQPVTMLAFRVDPGDPFEQRLLSLAKDWLQSRPQTQEPQTKQSWTGFIQRPEHHE